ncbi:hypothetical protein [Profundibacter sp.]
MLTSTLTVVSDVLLTSVDETFETSAFAELLESESEADADLAAAAEFESEEDPESAHEPASEPLWEPE